MHAGNGRGLRAEELNKDIDALHVLKNSVGYRLLLEQIQVRKFDAIDKLIGIAPEKTGEIGVLQGIIVMCRVSTGHTAHLPLVQEMIDELQNELAKLTRASHDD